MLTVTTTGGGRVASNVGGIACPSVCVASLREGTTVTLTATALADHRFDGWSGACSGKGGVHADADGRHERRRVVLVRAEAATEAEAQAEEAEAPLAARLRPESLALGTLPYRIVTRGTSAPYRLG